MKTRNLKITAFLLGSMLCFLSYSANARKSASRPVRKHTAEKKLSSSALANMKIKNIEFGFNKSAVPGSAFTNLDRIAKLMKDNNAALKLGGYADNKGAYVYNWMLSKARAASVKNYLVSKGADSSRIAATEYGYTKPIASNKTPQGRQKNRRVEIKFAN